MRTVAVVCTTRVMNASELIQLKPLCVVLVEAPLATAGRAEVVRIVSRFPIFFFFQHKKIKYFFTLIFFYIHYLCWRFITLYFTFSSVHLLLVLSNNRKKK